MKTSLPKKTVFLFKKKNNYNCYVRRINEKRDLGYTARIIM